MLSQQQPTTNSENFNLKYWNICNLKKQKKTEPKRSDAVKIEKNNSDVFCVWNISVSHRKWIHTSNKSLLKKRENIDR